MKLKDHVEASITEYPSLYARSTYQESKLAVYDHLFLCIGTGYEWANTKDPKQGGYLTYPVKKGYNIPYGRETFSNKDLHRFFDKSEIYVSVRENKESFTEAKIIWEGFIKDLPDKHLEGLCYNPHGHSFWYSEIENWVQLHREEDLQEVQKDIVAYDSRFASIEMLDNRLTAPYSLYIDVSWNKERYPVTPYDICPRFARAWSADLSVIQPDWKEGALETLEWALDFYLKSEWGNQYGERLWNSSYLKGKDVVDQILAKYDSWDKIQKDWGLPDELMPDYFKSIEIRDNTMFLNNKPLTDKQKENLVYKHWFPALFANKKAIAIKELSNLIVRYKE